MTKNEMFRLALSYHRAAKAAAARHNGGHNAHALALGLLRDALTR